MSEALISHIGIAVADLDKAIETYKLITGDDHPVIETVAEQKVRVAMFRRPGDDSAHPQGRIELVAATATDSPIARYIARNGEGLHHVCIYVDDIEERLAELKAAGCRLVDETPRVGAGGSRIAFVHPSSAHAVLIELEERG
jgi:methylmalonyl-CoA/ethylmalonyl-CoA epimerase